ncbi:hypothetical protein [Dethiothermospora halolimnae]|uniref:hypothetical protein n=1 Tax=Dethiothermospora halolimnae TaxID=3114390 RepID=UPI003CCC1BEE
MRRRPYLQENIAPEEDIIVEEEKEEQKEQVNTSGFLGGSMIWIFLIFIIIFMFSGHGYDCYGYSNE